MAEPPEDAPRWATNSLSDPQIDMVANLAIRYSRIANRLYVVNLKMEQNPDGGSRPDDAPG
jgi:hypothetical protein